MKKKFTKLTAALALLAFLAVPLGMRGQTRATINDVLTADYFTATNTTYTDFSGVSFDSDAVYAGNSGKTDSGGIQLRSKNSNSGIVSTSSGGTINAISVVVESGSNTLDVYGKNTAYSAASDLYNSSTQGTKIGSISATGTVDLTTYVDQYEYIGLRSKSGALYLTSITITWTTSGGTNPTFTVTYDANGGTGTMTDPNSPYEANTNVTLLPNNFTAPEGKIWDSWLVKDASDNTIQVSNNSFTMPASNVTVTAQWVDDPNAPQYNWVLTDLADLTSSDVFVIVGNNGNNYAMSNNNGTGSAPSAVSVTVADNKITGTVASTIQWNISGNATDGYVFYPNGSTTTWLYCTGDNNGVRVGATNTSNYDKFSIKDNYIYNIGRSAYLGVFNSQDWRRYTSINSNISGQSFAFYKKVAAGTIPPSITANNVNILFNAENGNINYTINDAPNPAGILTAAVKEGTTPTIANFIIGVVTNSTVPFTCSSNSEATEHTATVTLTYTYGENQIVTKDVDITQAAAPVIYTTIPEILAAATTIGSNTPSNVNVTFGNWVVSGVSGSNAFVTDNNGNGFIIYTSNHGFVVNNKLSGTVMGTPLKLYNGSAEFTNLTNTTGGLTVSNDGAITIITDKTIANLGGVNTGAVITLNNLTYDGTNLSDGTNNIKPYNTLYSGMSFTSGKTYNVTGVYQQFGNTKEILPRSAADIVEVVSTTPVINAENVNIAYDATSGEIEYTITNPTTGVDLAATTTADWVSNIAVTADKITFTTTANQGDADRTATFTLTYTGAADKTITVTQGHYVVDYATLPFTFDGGKSAIATTNGLTQENIGDDYANSPKLRFDKGNKDDDGLYSTLILKINERPGTLSFDIKNNSFSGGTFKVQTSEDGVTYTDLKVYTEITGTQSEEFNNLGENVRYIKWIYTEKVNGNVALGNIVLAEYVAPQQYTLTVSTLSEHIDGIFVFNETDQNNPLIGNGAAGSVQLLSGTKIIVSPEVEYGYVLQTLTVVDGNDAPVTLEDHMADGGYYSFTMPSSNVTITATAEAAPTPAAGIEYELFTGATLVEGDYIIYYDGKAMKNIVTNNNRLSYEEVTPNSNVITTDDATIVWHIAQSGEYWTIYSADVNKYAAGTNSKGQAALLDEASSDLAKWTVSVSQGNTYEFENYGRSLANSDSDKKYLRNNGTYGFACYSNSTGGTLSLYKQKVYTVTINGYGGDNTVTDGWYLIASPVSTTPTEVTNMIPDDPNTHGYDLYRFNQSNAENKQWENYRNYTSNFNITPGQGYLYANSQTVTLGFSGTVYTGNGQIDLVYDNNSTMKGYNLVGNPYNTQATVDKDFYVMNDAHTNVVVPESGRKVNAMEGIFVLATGSGQKVTFTQASSSTGSNNNSTSSVVMNLTQNRGSVVDRAIVRFGGNNNLPKLQLFENSTKLYVAQDGKDYAVVSAEAQGEMPVCFKASVNGSYTLSVDAENVEMGYLHLIDNLTGMDVDLLATPSYSFEAKTSDYASRFRLVFSANNIAESNSENFAFISNGQIILTNVDNDATVQVIDALGRMIVSTNANNHVYTDNMAPGVYVLRLVNGNDVKTQKIVVK